MVTRGGPSSRSTQGGSRKSHSTLDAKTPVSSSHNDLNSTGALLDYVGAAHYLCTTPRHVRELCLAGKKRHVAAVWKVGRRRPVLVPLQADLDAL